MCQSTCCSHTRPTEPPPPPARPVESVPRSVQTPEIFDADLAIVRGFVADPVDAAQAVLVWTFPLPDGRTFRAQISGTVLPAETRGPDPADAGALS